MRQDGRHLHRAANGHLEHKKTAIYALFFLLTLAWARNFELSAHFLRAGFSVSIDRVDLVCQGQISEKVSSDWGVIRHRGLQPSPPPCPRTEKMGKNLGGVFAPSTKLVCFYEKPYGILRLLKLALVRNC